MSMNDVSPRVRRAARFGALLAAGLGLAACQTPPPRAVAVPVPPPQRIFVYPNNGQSAEQTDRDRYECHEWAVSQTGVDPSRDANPYERVVVQPGTPPGANTAAGAVVGGVLGSIIGGPRNWGAGLALGAATGAIVGSAADANAQAQAHMTAEQIAQAQSQGRARLDTYRRAFGACMQGRGYTVT
ncbi:MAG TPA: hypothetical protein VKT22_02435 [Steroidobacteraceae bacterium]|nr:hypothetical protein [Steroidobacteraceae bacterium]